MSADLQDFRGKITAEAHCVLEALSRATGKDRAEIVREVLDEWAREKIHAANVLQGLLKAQGIAGSGAGTSGNRRDSRGSRGSAVE